MRQPVFVIVAAGTGGHILPGVRIGKALEGEANCLVRFYCGARPIEARAYASQGVTPRVLPIASGGLSPARLFGFVRAFSRLLGDFRRERPKAVIATGGAACFPALVAAIALRIPFFLHESNAVPGRLTRMFHRQARRIYSGHDLRGMNCAVLGTPGPEVEELSSIDERRLVLCMGGSQGASALNSAFAGAAGILSREFPELSFVLISGPGKSAVPRLGLEVLEYVDDMPSLLRHCCLALSRSGSGSLGDLAAFGIPAILVPYPHAMDDHQTANAEHMAERGGAEVMTEGELQGERLVKRMRELLGDRSFLAEMAEKAAACNFPNAAREIAVDVVRHAASPLVNDVPNPREIAPATTRNGAPSTAGRTT
jgi:UDP-N-acetylglucosamine--N-acetylmuramyl-(pentapeptide) pyrophosphoryl-undecaprenol N-acetylglucosamine transferase